jgi:hypothetical protein
MREQTRRMAGGPAVIEYREASSSRRWAEARPRTTLSEMQYDTIYVSLDGVGA